VGVGGLGAKKVVVLAVGVPWGVLMGCFYESNRLSLHIKKRERERERERESINLHI
jgi:hypothetical protein